MMKWLEKYIAPAVVALLVAGAANGAVYQWSRTAATNATADATINWSEGMSPSSVNDSARAMMARIADWRDDFSGVLATGGTSSAYTLTTNQGIPNPPTDGQLVAFTPAATNAAAVTLSVDGGAARRIDTAPGVLIGAGVLISGTPYSVKFNAATGAWILRNYFGDPFTVPLGAVLDYTGTTAPNSNFALANGQCISRTTYAAYFALVSTTFGACDGLTTFGVPDLSNRVVAGLQMAGTARITVAGGNFDGNALGASGGLQNHTMTLGELVAHTHTGTTNSSTATGTTDASGSHNHGGVTGADSNDHVHVVSVSNTTINYTPGGSSSGTLLSAGAAAPFNTFGESAQHTHTISTQAAHTHPFTTAAFQQTFTTASTGSATPFSVMPPTMVLSKIVRVF